MLSDDAAESASDTDMSETPTQPEQRPPASPSFQLAADQAQATPSRKRARRTSPVNRGRSQATLRRRAAEVSSQESFGTPPALSQTTIAQFGTPPEGLSQIETIANAEVLPGIPLTGGEFGTPPDGLSQLSIPGQHTYGTPPDGLSQLSILGQHTYGTPPEGLSQCSLPGVVIPCTPELPTQQRRRSLRTAAGTRTYNEDAIVAQQCGSSLSSPKAFPNHD